MPGFSFFVEGKTLKTKDVGVSYRTPGKHAALNAFLGKCVGVATTEKFLRISGGGTFHVIDCTAGDGQHSEFSTATSPGIICRHLQFLQNRKLPCCAEFYERSQKSAALLMQAVKTWPVINDDAANIVPSWKSNDVLFVVNDPNTIADWILPKALEQAPKLTTVFSTLGCNVGGLKRLKREEREVWYSHVENQLALLQPWHDALIVTLDGDKSQWAYLVNSPTAEGWQAGLESAFQKAFKDTGHALRMAWHRDQSSEFQDILDDLFLTRKERAETKQPPLDGL